jgi:hypothetical protein
MTTINAWEELRKGLELAEEMERNRPRLVKEYRLYYNEDGTIIGLWETNHPEGSNYIVLEDPDIFHKTNTNLLRVVNGEVKIGKVYMKVNGVWEEVTDDSNILKIGKDGQILTTVNNSTVQLKRLCKSNQGYRVVKGHAALLLDKNETYTDIEYYDRANS